MKTLPLYRSHFRSARVILIVFLLATIASAVPPTANAQQIHVDFVHQVTGRIVDLAVNGRGQIYLLDGEGTVTVLEATESPRTVLLLENVNKRFSFGTARGIAVDHTGSIFICDQDKGMVVKFSSTGQYVSHFGPAATHSEALDHPLDLAVDRFGRVFVVAGERVIHIYNNQGVYLGRLPDFNRLVDVGTDAIGNIYVLESEEPAIFVYDLNLELMTRRSLTTGIAPGLAAPEGIFVEPDGTVYVTDTEQCYVAVLSSLLPVDAPMTCYARVGIKGDGRGEFRHPTSVAVDRSGELFVADEKNRNVQVFSLSGLSDHKRRLIPPPVQSLPVIAAWRGDIHNIRNPASTGLESFAVDEGGTVYCADVESHSVVVYERSGRFVMSFGTEGKEPGRMKRPGGIAVGGEKDLFVLDTGNHRIQHWSTTGVFQRQFGKRGKQPLEFNNPSCLATGPSGTLVIADKENHRVQIVGPGGVLNAMVESVADEPLRKPVSVALESDSTLFVIEEKRPWIKIAGLKSGTSGSIGDTDKSPFVDPVSLAVDDNGTLFVLDAETGIYAFHHGPRLMAHFASLGDLVGQFRRPTQIRTGSGGDILVSDAELNKISVFHLSNVNEGAAAGRVHPVPVSGSVTIYQDQTVAARDSLFYDGSYLVAGVPPGDVTVAINAPGYTQIDTIRVRIIAGAVVRCEPIHLEATGSIAGTIIPSNPEAVVILTRDGESVRETTPDPGDGSYEFVNLKPGTYSVTANVPGFADRAIPRKVTVESGVVVEDTLYLKRPGSAAGVVTPPEAGAMGMVFHDTVTAARFAIRSDNGVFQTPPLHPETYTVVISAEGFVDHVITDVDILEGERRDLGIMELERIKTTTAEARRLLNEAKMLHLAADFEGAQAILDSAITTEEMAKRDLAEAYLWMAYSYFPFSELKERELATLKEALILHPDIAVDESFSPAFLEDVESVKDSLGLHEPEG